MRSNVGKQAWLGWRDLGLELVVEALIGLEIYFGIAGGNQQLAVLQKLNTGAGETAQALKTLTEEQNRLIQTQKDTLQTITHGQMAQYREPGDYLFRTANGIRH
jgi:hypothetical protein